MFSSSHSLIYNILKCRNCHKFHCCEFLLNGDDTVSKGIKTDIICGAADVLKSFRTVFQLKPVLQVSNALEARMDSALKFFVIKLHLHDALVNR